MYFWRQHLFYNQHCSFSSYSPSNCVLCFEKNMSVSTIGKGLEGIKKGISSFFFIKNFCCFFQTTIILMLFVPLFYIYLPVLLIFSKFFTLLYKFILFIFFFSFILWNFFIYTFSICFLLQKIIHSHFWNLCRTDLLNNFVLVLFVSGFIFFFCISWILCWIVEYFFVNSLHKLMIKCWMNSCEI